MQTGERTEALTPETARGLRPRQIIRQESSGRHFEVLTAPNWGPGRIDFMVRQLGGEGPAAWGFRMNEFHLTYSDYTLL